MITEHRDENHPQAAETHQLKTAPTLPDGQAAVMATMTSVMPWVISLFFHAGVLVIMAFITIVLLKAPAHGEDAPRPPTLINDELQYDTELTTTESELESDVNEASQSDWPSRDDTIPMPALGKETEITPIGLTGPPAGNNSILNGPGGDGFFNTSIYRHKRGPKPPERMGNARHIVYLVDCSGSMLDTFDEVRREMIRAITQLGLRPAGSGKQSRQTFHVIFFSSGKLRENPPRRLVPATKVNKHAAVKYLKTITSEKRTDPVPALKRAFAVLKNAPGTKGGKLIFLLTDGEFPDSEKVFRVINTLNADRSVHINTILHHHHSSEAVKVLRRIARENGGMFKFVRAE